MSAFLGAPALRLLLWLKLRGLVRRQWRRLRTPKGVLLTLLGAAAFGLWLVSLAVSFLKTHQVLAGEKGELHVRAFGLLLVLLSFSSALSNRGLYLPRTEIERLFSAPVSRADLVRYRLVAGGLRSLLGGLVLGLFAAQSMPNPWLAFAGVVLAMQTLPVLNQFLAIALGALERGAARALRRVGSVLLIALVALLVALVFALATDRPLDGLPLVGPWFARALASRGDLYAHPWLARATLPLVPWARMIAATSASAFAPWFALCLAVHVAAVELCARLPIDFRELSLATSARAAARLARVRRGGGVASTRADAAAARWRIPWLFGRGPAGAIAWRKCAGMARKAKGAFWLALVALLFITVFATLMLRDLPENRVLGTPLMITFLGTVYLCSGLRFDFREELERMDVVRAWPLPAERVFLAMLLPEVVLVALLVGATVLAEAALAGHFSAEVFAIPLATPLVVFAWVAGDNLVFLFAPVRTVPGQDGLVQNAGRRMLQMGLLGLLLGVLGGAGVSAALGANTLVLDVLGAPEWAARALGYAAFVLVVALGDLALVRLGGIVLRRFDVARDRG